jgi:exodeoxyribonuclease V beta subunit
LLADRPAVLDRLLAPDGLRRDAVIEASAGTGKTHALEHLVVDLVREGTPIERILVVTFTEKATLEMRARIRRRIADLVRAGDASLRQALTDFDRLPISTIHAFCQRVLAEHAFASGRLLEQQRVDARESFGRAFRDALRRGLRAGAREEPLLRAALARWTPHQIEDTLWSWAREPGEIRPRWDESAIAAALIAMPSARELDEPPGHALLATLHHATRRPIRERLTELARWVERARDGVPLAALLPELFEWGARPAPEKSTNARYLAEKLGSHPTLGAHACALRLCESPLPALLAVVLPGIRARLAEEKRARGVYDFDDMLRLVHEALEGPRGPEIVRALRERYRYALVDEFQDTDPIQWAIFRRMFARVDAGTATAEHALFVIGDPKQSIYGFRSADVHTYHAACAEIVAAGGAREPLVDCYRSSDAMIRALNRIFTRGFFTGLNRYDHPVRCARPELRAVDGRGAPLVPIQILHLHAREKMRAPLLRAALAGAIAEEIERLLDGGMQVSDREREDLALRALRPSDVFVLTRTGDEALEVAEELRRRGIVHALSTQDSLWETREARDVLDVLRAIEDPGKRAQRLRAWLTPFFGVPLEDLDACRELPGDHEFLLRLHRWATLAREHRFAALFSSMIEESGLARRLLFLREGERELVNYQHVLESLLALATRGRLGLWELIAELQARVSGRAASEGDDEDLQRLESERAAVQVLTMHKAKGLEAEVVFLFAFSEGRRKNKSRSPYVYHEDGARIAWIGEPPRDVAARVADEERQEDERLLYVAMTRARSRLYLPYVGRAAFPGTVVPAGYRSELFRDACGVFQVLVQRLTAIASEPPHEDDAELFESRVVVVGDARRRPVPPPPLPTADAGAAAPPLAVPPLPPDRFERLRAAARGVTTTSYSMMKRARALDVENALDDPWIEENALDDPWIEENAREPITVVADEGDRAFPGGTGFGLFIHEILEQVDFETVRASGSASALLSDPQVRELFAFAAERNGVAPEHLEASAELIRRALCTPIQAGALELPEGIARVGRRIAEMSFVYPIPERGHPPFGAWHGPDRPPLAVERGFVRGVIDLVFEHQGRTWVLDWKTDRLAAFDPSSIVAHVAAHYELQERLYALAIARLLRVESEADYERRFGGIVYCFVRGMRAHPGAPTEGVYVHRPELATLRAWDDALREEDAPWGYPMPPRPVPFARGTEEARP